MIVRPWGFSEALWAILGAAALTLCAFVANAASFVLPISNPANLVVYGAHMPTLANRLAEFGLAFLLSIVVTFMVLRFTQRRHLNAPISRDIDLPVLTDGGRAAAAGIAAMAIVLLVASSLDWQLGLPTFLAGCATAAVILALNRASPWSIVKEISWSVLPLVAGLFVLVQAVESTGTLRAPMGWLASGTANEPNATALGASASVAVLCNFVNNLPMGLLAGMVARGAHLSAHVTGALLIGVDLGPNLSVTGSLATILWLAALRREGQEVSAWQFLGFGCIAMPPALIAALAVFMWGKMP